MEGVGGAGLEVIFLVLDPRFIVLGMDKLSCAGSSCSTVAYPCGTRSHSSTLFCVMR